EAFFREKGARPAQRLAAWAGAEGRLIAGEADQARAILEASSADGTAPGTDGALLAVLCPLLHARLVLSSGAREDRSLAADLLAEAGAALVANPLPEWSARLEALRAAITPAEEAQRGTRIARGPVARHAPPPRRAGPAAWLRSAGPDHRRDGSGQRGRLPRDPRGEQAGRRALPRGRLRLDPGSPLRGRALRRARR